MKRKILVFVVAAMLVAATMWFAAGRLTQAQAQEEDNWWLSSAKAPEGASLPPSSPAEDPAVVPDDLEAPDALVSWRVTGSVLKPRESNVNYTVDINGSCVYVIASSPTVVWNTPVHLPQGTVVDTARMYYYDSSDSNSTGWFTIYDLYGEIVQEWSMTTSGNAGHSFSDSTPINHTVDNSLYSYVVNWRPIVTGSSIQLCGFRIFHDPPFFGAEFLPVIRNNNP